MGTLPAVAVFDLGRYVGCYWIPLSSAQYLAVNCNMEKIYCDTPEQAENFIRQFAEMEA